MHENGRKHKENAERFLSNVYRREEEDQKEQDRIKRELERIENVNGLYDPWIMYIVKQHLIDFLSYTRPQCDNIRKMLL